MGILWMASSADEPSGQRRRILPDECWNR